MWSLRENMIRLVTNMHYWFIFPMTIIITFPFIISTVIPIACGMTKISLNIIAASKSNLAKGWEKKTHYENHCCKTLNWSVHVRSNGAEIREPGRNIATSEMYWRGAHCADIWQLTCSVTSHANSGVRQMVKKSCFSLVARNSAGKNSRNVYT